MIEQEQLAKCIIGHEAKDAPDEQVSEFLAAANLAWPRVVAHTRRELAHHGLSANELTSLTTEIWETTIRSIWKTLGRRAQGVYEIGDLQNYLIGTFHRRLNRHLKRKRLNENLLDFLPPDELGELPSSNNVDYGIRIQQRIQLAQAYEMMDDCVKKAVIARLYGYSWAEIAKTSQLKEQNLIMRVQYAFRKIREFAGRGSKPSGS